MGTLVRMPYKNPEPVGQELLAALLALRKERKRAGPLLRRLLRIQQRALAEEERLVEVIRAKLESGAIGVPGQISVKLHQGRVVIW